MLIKVFPEPMFTGKQCRYIFVVTYVWASGRRVGRMG